MPILGQLSILRWSGCWWLFIYNITFSYFKMRTNCCFIFVTLLVQYIPHCDKYSILFLGANNLPDTCLLISHKFSHLAFSFFFTVVSLIRSFSLFLLTWCDILRLETVSIICCSFIFLWETHLLILWTLC